MQGRFVDQLGRTDLDDIPEIHDSDAIRDVPDHRQVVGNEDVGQLELVLKILHQVHDLGLDGHVQRADRLIGDDNLGIRRQRPRNADALALASGKFVRVPVSLFRRETHFSEQPCDLGFALRL